MNLTVALLIVSLFLNFGLLLHLINLKRSEKDLAPPKPEFTFAMFEEIYDDGIKNFGTERSAIISEICVKTAEALEALSTVDEEIVDELTACEIKNADLSKELQLLTSQWDETTNDHKLLEALEEEMMEALKSKTENAARHAKLQRLWEETGSIS